jgi:hypothetical protein
MRTNWRTTGWAALALLGVVALATSFLLHPTPPTVTRVGGQTFRSTTMHAVDYAIIAVRLAGVVLLAAGVYLTYRRLRPDAVGDTPDNATRRVERPMGAHPEAEGYTARPASGLWRNGP